MLFGGALAGLGGMVEVAGVEGQVRPGMMDGYGFIGFLASWLVRARPAQDHRLGHPPRRHRRRRQRPEAQRRPVRVAAVNILMSVLLLAILGWGQRRKAVA